MEVSQREIAPERMPFMKRNAPPLLKEEAKPE